MGLFGCSHTKWVNVGKVKEGYQQQKCSKCGRLRKKRVIVWSCVLFGMHQFGAKMKRKHAPKKVVCRKCGKPQALTPARKTSK